MLIPQSIAQGLDPTFLLQDVRGSAGKATSPEQPNSLALAHVAVACHLLDEPDTLDQAARALQSLANEPDRAATAIAAEVLDLFAQRRTSDQGTHAVSDEVKRTCLRSLCKFQE